MYVLSEKQLKAGDKAVIIAPPDQIVDGAKHMFGEVVTIKGVDVMGEMTPFGVEVHIMYRFEEIGGSWPAWGVVALPTTIN